jgi:hypothetical protein
MAKPVADQRNPALCGSSNSRMTPAASMQDFAQKKRFACDAVTHNLTFSISSYMQNCLQTEDRRQITTCNLHRILQIAQVAVDQASSILPTGMGGRGGVLSVLASWSAASFFMVRRSSKIICNPLRHGLQSPWIFASRSINRLKMQNSWQRLPCFCAER